MNIYFISGLGADKRIFSRINLDPGLNIIHLDWIDFNEGESLACYAKRLSSKIDQSVPFFIVGVSFGGMIATEIAKILTPKLTVIISSTVIREELPLIYRIAGKLDILKIIHPKLLKSANTLTQNYFFGVKTKDEKELLKQIVMDTDAYFLKWAIESILTWNNHIKPKRLVQIHGSDDKILYTKKARPDFLIKNGTHFMVYQKAVEISKILNELFLKKD